MKIDNYKLNNNYKLHELEISSDNNFKVRQKSVFLSDINVKNKIISYEDLIVMGNINAEYLLVSGNLIVSGELNVKEIDIEGSLICSSVDKLQHINVDGQIISIDEFKNNKNRLKIEEINIENIEEHTELLSDINSIKLKIIKALCDSKSDYSIEDIYKQFQKVEHVFVEFKKYNEFIALLISKYSNSEKYDTKLINYLSIMNYKHELPSWLLEISSINLILINLEKLLVNDMIVDFENKEEVNRIKYMTYRCEKMLGDKYNQILSRIKINECSNKEVNVDDLFKKYSEESSTYNLIEGIIKKIDKTKIILEIEEKVEAILTDYYDIGDKSTYKVGERIGVCILNISKLKSKIVLDVYRNSVKCMYENICKLNIPSLINLKKSNVEIVNNEELFIINYVGKEKIETIEERIKDQLKLNKIKVLDALDSKINNIAKIFNVNEDVISKLSDNEYTIKVFKLEHYRDINRVFTVYKKLLLSIGIKSVSANMISMKTKYNLYTKKINNLIEGKIKEKSENEYIVYVEDNVQGKLSKINANQEYSIGSEIIAKVDSVSLGNGSVYLKLNNTDETYMKDLIEYRIKQLNIDNMIDQVDICIKFNNIYDIRFILNEGYDQNLFNKLKTCIEKNTNKSNLVFTTTVKKTKEIINNSPKLNDIVSKSTENLDKEISMPEIVKIFNRKKKECGVPEIRIIKNARVEMYKTVIICSKLTFSNNKIKLLSLEYDMELELKGEKIKIVVYDEDIKSMLSDMLDLNKNNIQVDKIKRNIKINIKKEVYSEFDLKKEKTLLSRMLPYYNIDFIIKEDELNKKDTKIKNAKKQDDIDEDILDSLFK